jgi:hypothetical protein
VAALFSSLVHLKGQFLDILGGIFPVAAVLGFLLSQASVEERCQLRQFGALPEVVPGTLHETLVTLSDSCFALIAIGRNVGGHSVIKHRSEKFGRI